MASTGRSSASASALTRHPRAREKTRRSVINAMLAKLGASHTHYYTPEDPAYYQLADIFVGALEHRGLERVFPRGEVSYPGIGVFTEADNQGRIFVTGVIEGAPAHAAGVLLGDEIVSADNRPFRPVGSFRGKVGSPVSLEIRRASGAAPIAISVSPADLHPNEMFLRGLKESARIIADGQGQDWIRACLVLCEPQDSVRARGPDVRRTAQGRRRAGLGPARRMGRRATAISRPLQSARAHDEDHRIATARPASST